MSIVTVTMTVTVTYDTCEGNYTKQDFENVLYDNTTRMIGNGGLTGELYDAEVDDWSIAFNTNGVV